MQHVQLFENPLPGTPPFAIPKSGKKSPKNWFWPHRETREKSPQNRKNGSKIGFRTIFPILARFFPIFRIFTVIWGSHWHWGASSDSQEQQMRPEFQIGSGSIYLPHKTTGLRPFRNNLAIFLNLTVRAQWPKMLLSYIVWFLVGFHWAPLTAVSTN